LNRRRIALLATAGLTLTACDTMYGVRREEALKELPDLKCVERVVRAAPGVREVHLWSSQGGRPLTLSGIQQADEEFTFFYTANEPKIQGALQLIRHYTGKVEFSQTHLLINRPADPVVIANTRPVMREIEIAMSRECGIPELPGNIKETCHGVECPPMP
jgi:hypothetical protein